MLKRVMALFMAVLLLSGFSWGRSEEEERPVKTQQKAQTVYGDTSAARQSTYSGTAMKSQNAAANASVQAGTVQGQGQFPTQLLSSLASGDEEVRRARIESLRRLSEAMSKMNARQQSAAE